MELYWKECKEKFHLSSKLPRPILLNRPSHTVWTLQWRSVSCMIESLSDSMTIWHRHPALILVSHHNIAEGGHRLFELYHLHQDRF